SQPKVGSRQPLEPQLAHGRGVGAACAPRKRSITSAVRAGPQPAGAQYVGSDGSTWLAQASTPPPTCTASEKPAFLTTARHSALRAPLLQCSTILRSCGSFSRAAPLR